MPVGTAVFTENAWRSLKDAAMTCLDYSEERLAGAKERLFGCGHKKRNNLISF